MTQSADPASAQRQWATVAVAWLGSLAVFVVWLRGTPASTLSEQLKVLQYWSLNACVLLGAALAVRAARASLVPVVKRHGLRMAAVASVALALVLIGPPRTNRIFYDEQIYESVGQNLAALRLAQVCNDGTLEDGRLQCARGEYNKQPYAYPHLLALTYRVAGVHVWNAFAINAAIMPATACAVYLLVIALFGDRSAALIAGLLIAATPEQLMWSATAAVEPSASLAAALSVICAAGYLRLGGTARMAALAVSAAYAIQFRPESILILPVLALLAWPRLRTDLENPRGWWSAVLFLWLTAVPAAHLYAVRHAGWGTDSARFSMDFAAANLRVNGWFYLWDERFPSVFALLALLGLAAREAAHARVCLALYFVVFFGIDLAFYAGSYNYGADVRYSLMTYPPLAVLGGLGGARLGRLFARGLRVVKVEAVGAILALLPVLWYWPVIHAAPEEAWAARADVRFAESAAKQLPQGSYVLTHNPGMFHLWGESAGQMSLAVADPEYLKGIARRAPKGLYVHWNFWCGVEDPVQPEICRRALTLGETELVREYHERDQRYAFYRLRIEY
jgi:hypothetical protein